MSAIRVDVIVWDVGGARPGRNVLRRAWPGISWFGMPEAYLRSSGRHRIEHRHDTLQPNRLGGVRPSASAAKNRSISV